jgi:hypothetical protein
MFSLNSIYDGLSIVDYKAYNNFGVTEYDIQAHFLPAIHFRIAVVEDVEA